MFKMGICWQVRYLLFNFYKTRREKMSFSTRTSCAMAVSAFTGDEKRSINHDFTHTFIERQNCLTFRKLRWALTRIMLAEIINIYMAGNYKPFFFSFFFLPSTSLWGFYSKTSIHRYSIPLSHAFTRLCMIFVPHMYIPHYNYNNY